MTAARDQVVFLLNGERHEVPRSVPPTRTLLDYLREDLRLLGTKEGCNEGDCGACTVVVGEGRGPDGPRYRALNACIMLLPMVDGRAVVTVEGLGGPAGELHPVQQAMVDCHGSQCGYCTPGFVMSLYAAHRGPSSGEPDMPLEDLLAGNLCRCTGYGPILEAGQRARILPAAGWDGARLAREKGALDGLPAGSLRLEHPSGSFHSPCSLDELAELYAANPQAVLLGGATDVGLWLTKQLRTLPVMIATGRVPELQRHGLADDRQSYRIGAAVTYGEAATALAHLWPDLGELVRRIGSVQVRNAGTIGGNIANGSPIGDMAPALIALGASLELRQGAARRSLPLEDFFLAYGKQDRRPGELVEAISVPVSEASRRDLRCYKVAKRFDQDISAVCGCLDIRREAGKVTAARIAFGGMAATPKRARAVEAALLGRPWSLATVEAALPAFATDFQPITDQRASAAYRLLAAGNLLRRYFHETELPTAATRLVGAGAALAAAEAV